jgi:hypothetical protein
LGHSDRRPNFKNKNVNKALHHKRKGRKEKTKIRKEEKEKKKKKKQE